MKVDGDQGLSKKDKIMMYLLFEEKVIWDLKDTWLSKFDRIKIFKVKYNFKTANGIDLSTGPISKWPYTFVYMTIKDLFH